MAEELSGQAPVAHSCNPSYSEGRDQEDGDSRPYLEKNPSQKRAGGVAQGEVPEFKVQ
jgi:hypothetical protein